MRIIKRLSVFLIAMAGSVAVQAADPVENVMQGCSAEIENFCSQVTPGEGRLMACFYAHEDKLSVGCINALYDGAVALEAAVEALVSIATACETDIDAYCLDTVPGEGRILNCLISSQDSLSEACSAALQSAEE